MPSANTTAPLIVIAGNTIGALAAALALQQSGIETLVLGGAGANQEDLDADRPVVLWPNATRRLRHMGVLEAVQARSEVVRQTALRSWRGRPLWASEAAAQQDAPALFLRRGALRDVLAAALTPGSLTEDAAGPVTSPSQGTVDVEREGRDPVAARLLVDARLPGPQQGGVKSAEALVRGVTTFSHRRLPEGMVCAYWGKGRQLGVFATADRLFWEADLPARVEAEAPPGDASELRRQLISAFAGWISPVPHIVAGSPLEQLVLHAARYEQAEAPPEREGIIRIGQASHAAGAALGQQASFAIEEAELLARCLTAEEAGADVSAALDHFRQQRAERLAPVPTWTRQAHRLRPSQRTLARQFQEALFGGRMDRQLRDAEEALFTG